MTSATGDLVGQLRTYARWTREAQTGDCPPSERIDIGDVDADMLDEAAAQIERLSSALLVAEGALDRLIEADTVGVGEAALRRFLAGWKREARTIRGGGLVGIPESANRAPKSTPETPLSDGKERG